MTEYDPKLVERMVALVRGVDERAERLCLFGPDRNRSFYAELRAIKSELPAPVDPDLLLAREVVVASVPHSAARWGEAVNAGELDYAHEVIVALAAIKRVRAEQA